METLTTPYFLVSRRRVQANCDRMRSRCSEWGVHLRPHMKTHKTIEAASVMTGVMKDKSITVSTLAEAEFYANAGFDDILLASLLAGKVKLDRAHSLTNKLSAFHVLVDSVEHLEFLEPYGASIWSIFVNVDCGYGRLGAPATEAARLVRTLLAGGFIFAGLYAHCGDSYYADTEEVGNRTSSTLIRLADEIRLLPNIPAKFAVAVGSTPCCSQPAEAMAAVTEWHPGNYVFYDYMQVILGSCQLDDVACRVATRVLAHHPSTGQLFIDCGFTGLSHDGRKPDGSFSVVFVDHPELTLTRTTQEVGQVAASDGYEALDYSKYPIGSLLYIVPYHSCATADKYPRFYVEDDFGHGIVDTWESLVGVW